MKPGETIGERLKRVRERAGFSQRDLESASGIAVSLISRYERDIVTPMWQQIERILDALKMSPCDLFEDYCVDRSGDEDGTTFSVRYWERRPDNPEGAEPTATVRFRKNSPLVALLGLAAVDDRYTIIQATTDSMIPDIYPGDFMLADRSLGASVNRVIGGFIDGYPMLGRLTIHQKQKYIVPSNRNYNAVEYDPDKWDHRGVIIHSVRNLTVRYTGGMFVDESSDVLSLRELRKRRGGGGDLR